ncbi:arylamine N-acetyltransferase [Streptomyces sp. ALI-76-A]|uniref:arylamine N-acetyltransferase family protein n=1 Tax=Streptomyces sp. ALI-76-A TaxID=3025736 RepID=UPI00256F43F1|nr:arylamine N-acetyltransferase [Streptomyces sp. ALI-76-A]MDL5201534.1 arylamine N-acetyltransferase [Streptomyces sp. ALI-76-A]
MDSALIDAYLRRLGYERPPGPTGATLDVLRELQLRHLRTVPFENLAVHLGEEIVLEEERLLDKVVGARRGGFCYELNGAFGALLGALGFDVTLLAARVYADEGRLGIPYDHLALRVRTVDAGVWLADVGFGAHSHWPLAFEARGEQRDPVGTFRIVEAGPDAAGRRGGGGGGDGGSDKETQETTQQEAAEAERDTADSGTVDVGELVDVGDPGAADLDVLMDGRAQYRLETRPRVLGDFVAGAWWHSTSPASHFTQSLVCSRVTEDGGRITLSGRTFKVTGADGTREEREIGTDEEVLAVYRERFGIALDEVPTVRGAGQWRRE